LTATTEAKSQVSADSQREKAKKRWNGKSKDERSTAMSEVAHQRWSGQAQDEQALRQYFENAPFDEALEAYAAMRRNYEIAGKIVDVRVQKERSEEKCANCGKAFDENTLWYNREAVKDPQTGTIRNIFSCSQACMIAIKGKVRKPRP
jgi:hypothetical protein